MTRFDAANPAERQKLFADAIAAHRARDSAFLTIEAPTATDDGDEGGTHEPAPWIQFADGVVNMDCTDEELDRLEALLNEFPAFKISELTRPDDVEGTNVRVSALADANRIAQFLDRCFRDVYERPEDYEAWAVSV